MAMKFTVLRRTCKQAAALLVAREDRALSLPDSVALRLHLMACKACPRFENQILTMRQAMAQWRQMPPAQDDNADRAGRRPL
jgi:hypothetical protein